MAEKLCRSASEFFTEKMVAYQKLRKSSEKLHPLKNGFQLKLQFFFFAKIFFPSESDPDFFRTGREMHRDFSFRWSLRFPGIENHREAKKSGL